MNRRRYKRKAQAQKLPLDFPAVEANPATDVDIQIRCGITLYVKDIYEVYQVDEMKNLIFYLSELSMAHYACIKYSPSMIAASAVYVARRMLKPRCQWSRALEIHSGYKKGQLKDCAELIAKLQGEMANENAAADRKLKELHHKYSVSERDEVAQLPPANA